MSSKQEDGRSTGAGAHGISTAPASHVREFDVAIVGARVAGASLALLLARAGHRVALVDRVVQPADTLSTHICAPSAQVMWRRWGLHDAVLASGAPATATARIGVDGDDLMMPWPGNGGPIDALHHPRRTVLDPIVLTAAVDAGVTLFDRTTFDDVVRDPSGRVVGIAVRGSDGSSATIGARYAVGADGWRSRVARAVRADAYDQHPVTNATHYAYYRDLDLEGLEIWLSSAGLMAGVVPTNDGSCVYVNCHSERAELLRAGGDDRLERLIRSIAPDLHERLLRAVRTSPIRGTSGIPSFKRQPSGPGWLLVGDAGCTKDPISAHGISDAMVTADLAAFHLDAALQGASEREALDAYRVRRDDFVHDVYTSTARLARYDWTRDEAWALQADIGNAWTNAALTAASLPDWTAASAVPAR